MKKTSPTTPGSITGHAAATPAQEQQHVVREGNSCLASGDVDAALQHYLLAAEAGHVPAMREAGRVQLLLGDGRDAHCAGLQWLRRAESGGDAHAAYLLAMVALGDRLEPLDFERTLLRLRRSASSGFVPALRGLALLAGRGRLLGDQVTACMLLGEAAGAGDPLSAMLLAERLRLGDGIAVDHRQAERLQQQLRAAGVAPLPTVPALRVGAPAGNDDRASAIDLGRALAPPAAKVLSEHPRVWLVDGLLSPEECRLVIAMARPHLRRSRAFDPQREAAGEFEIRTSSDAAFDPTLEDFTLRLLQARIARAAGADLVHGEPLVVLRYEPGQHYLPHRDYLPPGALATRTPEAGQRRSTVCVYLNPVESGGETAFTVPGIAVRPVVGSAVVFDNLLPDGSPDPDSQHAGMPVIAGEKWLATLWLRQRDYRRY